MSQTTWFSDAHVTSVVKPWYCTLPVLNGSMETDVGDWYEQCAEHSNLLPACWYQVGYAQSTDRHNELAPKTLWGDNTKDFMRFWDFEVSPALEDVQASDVVYKVIHLAEIEGWSTFELGGDSYGHGWSATYVIPCKWQWTRYVGDSYTYGLVPQVTQDGKVLCYVNTEVSFRVKGSTNWAAGKDNQIGDRKIGGKVPGNDAIGWVYEIGEEAHDVSDPLHGWASSKPIPLWIHFYQSELPGLISLNYALSSQFFPLPAANCGLGELTKQYREILRQEQLLWLMDYYTQVEFPNWRPVGLDLGEHGFGAPGVPDFPVYTDMCCYPDYVTWQHFDPAAEEMANPYNWNAVQRGWSYLQLWGHWSYVPQT